MKVATLHREKEISFKPFTGKCSDSFVLLKDGSIGKILAIHCNDGKNNLKVQLYSQHNFFENPIQSTDVGIYKLVITSVFCVLFFFLNMFKKNTVEKKTRVKMFFFQSHLFSR